jgi:Uma2 family endonuclease
MPVTEAAFRKLALEEPDAQWELDCGVPRKKPGMTAAHNEISLALAFDFMQQLDRDEFRVRHNDGHVRRSAEHYYIPDVSVIPTQLVLPKLGERTLEVYEAPLPLVVEVWSASTGDYDVRTKLTEYQRRGDLEIWLLHPYDRVLNSWVRQADGTYKETTYRGGVVRPSALPGVAIDLDALFDRG